MKTKLKIIIALTMICGMMYGQSFKLPWTVLDGGGGKASGGTLMLASSAGQSAAPKMTYIDTGMVLEGGYIPGLRTFNGTWVTTKITPTLSWNFISVPLRTSDMRKTTLYPAALSAAFNFEPGGYRMVDTLEVGKAYWLKFPNTPTAQYSITGNATMLETLFVYQGWNMIGTLSYPVLITSITPLPPVTITSQYFGYTTGISYYTEDTLKPGWGYWVKSSRAGYIVLKNTGIYSTQTPIVTAKNSSEVEKDQQEFLKFTVKDNKGSMGSLLFASEARDIDLDKYELPPLPPEGMDIRFASGRFAEVPRSDKVTRQEFPIQLTGAAYPVKLSWDAVSVENGQLDLEVTYSGEKPKQYSLQSSGNAIIQEENFINAKIVFTGNPVKLLPKEFALYQNFPNPFNPTTKIKYDLPVDSKVSLKIYNLIGQEVKVLVDGLQEAGFKAVQFDAKELPSGVYFYRLQANDFTTVKKLMLLK